MLGALISFLVLAVLYYDYKIVGDYRIYLKGKRKEDFPPLKCLAFIIINASLIWFVVFGVLANIDRRSIRAESAAWLALLPTALFFLPLNMRTSKALGLS